MQITETCPHCDHENSLEIDEGQWVCRCGKCGKVIPLCNRCAAEHPGERPCGDCLLCDVANFMNYLGGFATAEQFLGSLNPPLTDMTTGLPEGTVPTLDDYLNDTYGDDVNWDVKYWDIYALVKESFLNANSSEADCRDFVAKIVEKNKN